MRAGSARAARRTAALLTLWALAAAPVAAEDDLEGDPCAPVRARPSPLPDLQQLAEAVCRSLGGEAEPGSFPERWRLAIGGWLDASYRDNDARGGDASHELDHVNLHVDARFEERWQLFFEGEYEHEPALRTGPDEREWEVEQLYGEYRHGDSLRLRGGRFSTSFGYWVPVHWSILVDTIEPPIHDAVRIVPEQQNGLQLFGSLFEGRWLGLPSELDYALYGGYAGSGTRSGDADGFTGGGDLRLHLDRHMLGVSLYTQESDERGDRRDGDLDVYGELSLPFHLLFRTEYVRQQRREDATSPYRRNPDLVYAKLRWDFLDDAYLNYRFEWGEDDEYGPRAEHTIHRVTLGWQPLGRLRLKAEYARNLLHDSATRDYDFWGVSAGIFF